MKEVIKKVIDFYKEYVGTRWLIKDIIVAVLSLTIPTACTSQKLASSIPVLENSAMLGWT